MTQDALSGLADVRTERVGHMGRIVLDRPKRLNALDAGMAQAIDRVLDAWEQDDGVAVVVLESSSPRAFCAGGDLRAIREALLAHGPESTFELMDAAYATMLRLADYPKPVVSLLDGIVMGGGVGIGCHVSHRVVTERSVLAMPETSIGLVTDAGGSWLLSRPGGHEGLRLALTGGRVTGAQAVALGLADGLVPSDSLDALRAALSEQNVDDALAGFVTAQGDDGTVSATLEACYAAPDMAGILARLEACPLEEARQDLDDLSRASPSSLLATWLGWHAARKLGTLHDVFDLERRLVRHVLAQPDLAEGVRARLVDRDNTPVWQPATLADVDAATIQRVVDGV